MPPPVPKQFENEPEYTLWRDIARLQEDYIGSREDFLVVLNDIRDRLLQAEVEN